MRCLEEGDYRVEIQGVEDAAGAAVDGRCVLLDLGFLS